MRNITMNEGEKHMGTKIMYNHKAIEKKWREKWAENSVNPRVDDNGSITVLTCFRIRQETVFMSDIGEGM